ncbi:hypothetical protein NDU88_002192 [Pleurodeles waltl]|uniref:Uncharacterized protein n=1 Tax=Pleurodeles waltl TaxID=8319 RepID=A0AAV7VYP4_PLEWA|nr:hypothetical protein NDU88_002192 [Pleurodeles waltl]
MSPAPPSQVHHSPQSCSTVPIPAGIGTSGAFKRRATVAAAHCRAGPKVGAAVWARAAPPDSLRISARRAWQLSCKTLARDQAVQWSRPTGREASRTCQDSRPLRHRRACSSSGPARGSFARPEATTSAPRPQAPTASSIQGGRET